MTTDRDVSPDFVKKSHQIISQWLSTHPLDAERRAHIADALDTLKHTAEQTGRADTATRRVALLGPEGASRQAVLLQILGANRSNISTHFGEQLALEFPEQLLPDGVPLDCPGALRLNLGDAKSPACEEYPLTLGLLSLEEVLNTLCEWFLGSPQPSAPKVRSGEAQQLFEALADQRFTHNANGISSAMLQRLRHRYQERFAKDPRTASLRDDFWGRLVRFVPQLSADNALRLLSLLWAHNRECIDTFQRLQAALSTLNYAHTIAAGVFPNELGDGALFPIEHSLLAASTNTPDARVAVRVEGKDIAIERVTLRALLAEVTLNVRVEAPQPHADFDEILYFPEAPCAPGLSWQGAKLGVLYRRLTQHWPIDALCYCRSALAPAQETLDTALAHWVELARQCGATSPWILALTQFERLQSRVQQIPGKQRPHLWQEAVTYPIRQLLGPERNWAEAWDAQGAYRHTHWLASHPISDDAEDTQATRHSFLSTAQAARHFDRAEQAWRQVCDSSDGGVAALCESLSPTQAWGHQVIQRTQQHLIRQLQGWLPVEALSSAQKLTLRGALTRADNRRQLGLWLHRLQVSQNTFEGLAWSRYQAAPNAFDHTEALDITVAQLFNHWRQRLLNLIESHHRGDIMGLSVTQARLLVHLVLQAAEEFSLRQHLKKHIGQTCEQAPSPLKPVLCARASAQTLNQFLLATPASEKENSPKTQHDAHAQKNLFLQRLYHWLDNTSPKATPIVPTDVSTVLKQFQTLAQ